MNEDGAAGHNRLVQVYVVTDTNFWVEIIDRNVPALCVSWTKPFHEYTNINLVLFATFILLYIQTIYPQLMSFRYFTDWTV